MERAGAPRGSSLSATPPAPVLPDVIAKLPAQRIPVIVGPTASGKSELAVRIAEQLHGEIIGADSVQVYRRFDAGSGKPTAEQRARVPHHFVDELEPGDALDAAAWASAALERIAAIRARGRRPVVCGGTFLWVRALIWGLAPAPPGDEQLREQHRALVHARGSEALHAQLAEVDAQHASRLAPNDVVRVSRALEVFQLTGKPMSDWQREHGFRAPRLDAQLIGVAWPRSELDARIRTRVGEMFAAGWVDEVRALLGAGFGKARAMRSVGYRQIATALDTEALGGALAELHGNSADPGDAAARARELEQRVVSATRVFVRRQRTWLRDRDVCWLQPSDAFTPDGASE